MYTLVRRMYNVVLAFPGHHIIMIVHNVIRFTNLILICSAFCGNSVFFCSVSCTSVLRKCQDMQVVMVLPPSEPRITITAPNRLVRPAGDLRGPLGVAPFKELRITSTVMKGDSFGGCEWREVILALQWCCT